MKLEELTADLHFSSAVYMASYPNYLELLTPIVQEYIDRVVKNHPQDDVYPAIMTEVLHFDERVVSFRDDVLQQAWNILDSQGYFMDPFYTTMTGMWGQSHPRLSSMDYHVHGDGNQLNAFYFLEVPENSSQLFVHDPRSAKNITSLPIKQTAELTLAHGAVGYTPKAGDLYFANSWLPHSFSRNRSHQDFKFIHININVINNPDYRPTVCEAPIIV